MQGDFSRLTFNQERHYSAVLMQQGRVQVDADWNEQQALTRYRTEVGAADVIGRCGGPHDNAAFGVIADLTKLLPDDLQKLNDWCKANGKKLEETLNGDFVLTAGRYYADGILCESEGPVLFTIQPDYIQKPLAKEGAYAIYLDVWHRHITALDDDYIREKALGCPDTTSRQKVVWQVKAVAVSDLQKSTDDTNPNTPIPGGIIKKNEAFRTVSLAGGSGDDTTTDTSTTPTCEDVCPALKTYLAGGTPGTLAARTQPAPQMDTACQLPPNAGYQRLENQLYRVEIRKGGTFKSGSRESQITFKWSRDNGTVVTAITDLSVDKNGATITVKDVGPDDMLGFATGQWVEVLDDSTELNGAPGDLVQITGVSAQTKKLTVSGHIALKLDARLHPKLRRWDQTSTASLTNGVMMNGDWQSLEDGVQVQFSDGVYKTGDFWLIPGRTATADIEWPQALNNAGKSQPQSIPAIGIKHHYCCLAIVNLTAQKPVTTNRYTGPIPAIYDADVTDCRCLFPTLCQLQEAAAELKPCIKITNVTYGGDYGSPLVNGATIGFKQLLIGIQLACDHGVDGATINRATAFVTLELPYPAIMISAIVPIIALLPKAESFTLGGKSLPTVGSLPTLGYQPLVLAGNPIVDETKTNLIRWLPETSYLEQVAAFLSSLVKSKPVLARLTLKGNFIWSEKDSTMYLDGEAFGTNDSTMTNGIQLPSGDGRRGGDFEMWFYVGLEDSRGELMVLQTKTSTMEKYIISKYTALKHDFPGSVAKNAFTQKYGADTLSDGGTVADALGILAGNPSFSSVDAMPDILATTEARSLQANIGNGKILDQAFGTTNISGNLGDITLDNLTAIPDSVRNNLPDSGISTVADLASASPATIKQTATSLTAKGFNVTSADLAGYAGLAKILVKLP